MDWLDLLAVQRTLKSLLQHHSSKASALPYFLNRIFRRAILVYQKNWGKTQSSLIPHSPHSWSFPLLVSTVREVRCHSWRADADARLLIKSAVGGAHSVLYVLGACAWLCWVAQSCPTLCSPTDRSPPGSSVHWILQARTLESAAISFSGETSRPEDQIDFSGVSCIGKWLLYHEHHLGSPDTFDRFEQMCRNIHPPLQDHTGCF